MAVDSLVCLPLAHCACVGALWHDCATVYKYLGESRTAFMPFISRLVLHSTLDSNIIVRSPHSCASKPILRLRLDITRDQPIQ
jgi:hypothetical protein